MFAQTPLSGEGAKRFGGRFNRKGTPALYTALSPETALRESHQVGHLQPTVLVCYQASITPVFDARTDSELKPYGLTKQSLAANDWREQMRLKKISDSQRFAEQLVKKGFHGMLCESYAAGATQNDTNLVLWRWNLDLQNYLRVIDDENRLLRRH